MTCSRQDKVRFIRNPTNQGPAETRNIGIREAKGNYIALLDHDDVWLPEFLERSLSALLQANADVAYSSVRMFSTDSSDLGTWGPTPEDLANFPLSLLHRCYITLSTTVIRKESLQAIGLFDPSANLRGCEDYDCWIQLIRSECRFVHIPEILCLRRKHDEALTKNLKEITKAELFVIQKHSDWSILSGSFLNARITSLNGRLADIYVDNGHIRGALQFAVGAWLRQPLSFNCVKRMVKILMAGCGFQIGSRYGQIQ